MNTIKTLLILMLPIVFGACGPKDQIADAYGNFEADEMIISSKANGEVLHIFNEEGQIVNAHDRLLQCDTVDFALQRHQLLAQKASVMANKANVLASISVLEETIKGVEKEQKRIHNLFADEAATSKQKDDIDNQISILKKQRGVNKAKLISINAQAAVFDTQINLIDKKIKDCLVSSSQAGTILEQYIEEGELATIGKPLFKLAKLQIITLKVYISGEQLSEAKIGDEVKIKIDAPNGTMKTYKGIINWISSEAEFTPKVVQTKAERVKQVYATKIKVKNDGTLKIGMPGEMYFQNKTDEK